MILDPFQSAEFFPARWQPYIAKIYQKRAYIFTSYQAPFKSADFCFCSKQRKTRLLITSVCLFQLLFTRILTKTKH